MKLYHILALTCLLGYLLVPHFVFVQMQQSSLGTGLLAVAAVLLAYYAARRRLHLTRLQLGILFVISFSIVFSCLQFGFDLVLRQILSLMGISVVFLATNSMFRAHLDGNPRDLRRSFSWIFTFLVMIGVAGKLRIFTPGNYALLPKPIFPFSEESHYALTLSVVACAYMMQLRPKFRIAVCLLLGGLAIWFPNTTMLGASLFIAAVLFSLRAALIFIGLGTVVLLAPAHWLTAIDVDYFGQRLKVGESAENLTTVIYFQGWEQGWIATWEGRGIGVGFQRFGSEPPGSRAQYVDAVYGLDLNRKDGSNVGSKLLGEFGLIGLLALVAAACAGVWAFRGLRRLRGRDAPFSVHVLHLSVVYMFIIELFFRGLGYLNPTLFLYLYCISRLGMTRYMRHSLGRLSASTR